MRLNFILLAFIKSMAINIYLGTVAADEIFAWLRRYYAITCIEKYKREKEKKRITHLSESTAGSEVGHPCTMCIDLRGI